MKLRPALKLPRITLVGSWPALRVFSQALFERLNDKYRNATKDKDSGVWQIACSYKGQDEVHLMFEGETNPTFSFKLQHFIDQIGEKCVLRIRPKAREDANPDYWSMGLPFFRKYCANFYLDCKLF